MALAPFNGKEAFTVRHCYRCNKSGIPISGALCDECKKQLKPPAWPEYVWALLLVILMSVAVMYWSEVSG